MPAGPEQQHLGRPLSPYYDADGVTIYHGNLLKVLPQLEGVGLVVTSPPYNLAGTPWPHLGHWKPGDASGSGGKAKWRNGGDSSDGAGYDTHEDAMPWPAYVEWQQVALRAIWGALSPDGAIFYNHRPRVVGTRLWTPLELNPGLPLRQIIIWARAGGLNYSPTAFVPMHEWIMVLAKDDFRLRSKAASGAGDVWRIPQEPNSDHPAPFPVGLPARAIEATAPRLVLDPFMGSGTTLRAAMNAGVQAIGIEQSERYCEVAVRRLAQGVLAL